MAGESIPCGAHDWLRRPEDNAILGRFRPKENDMFHKYVKQKGKYELVNVIGRGKQIVVIICVVN